MDKSTVHTAKVRFSAFRLVAHAQNILGVWARKTPARSPELDIPLQGWEKTKKLPRRKDQTTTEQFTPHSTQTRAATE